MIKPLEEFDLNPCPKGCKCDVCKFGLSMDEVKKKQEAYMEKCGFFSHFVDEELDGFVNYHTHGFSKTWNHPDFQMVIPIEHALANEIFWDFAERVKNGEKFKPGDQVDKVIRNYPVRLARATEGNREVLRIIYPDKNGLFPGDDGVNYKYGKQPNVEV